MASLDDAEDDKFGVLSSIKVSYSDCEEFSEDDLILRNISENEDGDDCDADFLTQGTPLLDNLPTPNHAWINVTEYDPGPTHQIPVFNPNNGLNLPTDFNVDTKPIQYFELFFNEDVRTHICNETNYNAEKRKNESTHYQYSRLNSWTPISDCDFKAFLGAIINMGLRPLPSMEEYFTTKWEGRMPFFSDVFSKTEFFSIIWNLHFNHDENEDLKPKEFLISPVVEHMRTMCKLFFTPGNRVFVDGSQTTFTGKMRFDENSTKQLPTSTIRVYVAYDCDSGYIYDFIPYFGKRTLLLKSNLLKSTQIIKELIKSIVKKDPACPPTGLHVYTDQNITSPELAIELLKMKCFLTGPVMHNKMNMPSDLKKVEKQLMNGDLISQRKDDILVLSWRDRTVTTMLSTNNSGSKADISEDRSMWPCNILSYKPNVIIDYDKTLKPVKQSNEFISSYHSQRRTKRWYLKLFYWLLEVAIVDAYVLYKMVQEKHHRKPMSHREFRSSLVTDLVEDKVSSQTQATLRRRAAQGPPEERLQGRHFMQKRPKGCTRCIVCSRRGFRKETIYYCKTCTSKPSLHPENCFEIYHTMAYY